MRLVIRSTCGLIETQPPSRTFERSDCASAASLKASTRFGQHLKTFAIRFPGRALSFQSKSVHQPTPNSSTLRCNNSDVAMPPKRRPAARARAPKRAPKRAAKRRASSSRVDGEELDWEIRERPGECGGGSGLERCPLGRRGQSVTEYTNFAKSLTH